VRQPFTMPPLYGYAPSFPQAKEAHQLPMTQFELAQIVKSKQHQRQVPVDKRLAFKPMDSLKNVAHTYLVRLPQALKKGLTGEQGFNFSDAMLIGRTVPYCIGGAMLLYSYIAGGDYRQAFRIATSIIGYMGTQAFTKAFIDWGYNAKHGVDLNLPYLSQNGRVENALISSDFPYFQMISEEQYDHMAKKMGIPDGVYDRDGAVRQNLQQAINRSRVLKTVSSTLLSAFVAGYLANSSKWETVGMAVKNALKSVLAPHEITSLGTRLLEGTSGIRGALSSVLKDRLSLSAGRSWVDKALIFAFGLTATSTALYTLFLGVPKKQYTVGKIDQPNFEPDGPDYTPWMASNFTPQVPGSFYSAPAYAHQYKGEGQA
jgi:hypothetical protein